MLALVARAPGGPVPLLAPAHAPLPPPTQESVDGSVEVSAYRPGRVLLDVDARRPTALLVRESWSRGWRVRVDGAPATLHPAAGLYFAVPLERGRHAVELRYATPGLPIGIAAVGAWAALAVTVCIRRRAGNREVTTVGPV